VTPESVETAEKESAEGHRRAVDPGASPAAPMVSVVVPTRNEAGNVERLIRLLDDVVPMVPMEIVFVDDSDDDTVAAIERAGRRSRRSVEVIHRAEGERSGGLGGAVLAGLRRARGAWACVMDADLQHPPAVLQQLLECAETRDVDVVVASRLCAGGDLGDFGLGRRAVSHACGTAAKAVFPRRLRGVSDPMSGFFMVRRAAVDLDALRPRGFKILLEILARTPGLRVAEVPFRFGERNCGDSKASLAEGLRYLGRLLALRRATTSVDRVRLGAATAAAVAILSIAGAAPTVLAAVLCAFLALLAAAPRQGRTTHYSYDIHGIVTVDSPVRLRELESFLVPGERLADPTVRIEIGRPRRPRGTRADGDHSSVRYAELAGRGFAMEAEFGDRVRIVASPLLRYSPHVLYTNVVEPILRWRFVEQGYALVHAACLALGKEAFLVTARTDTGKTTTCLKALDARPYAFVSDDLTLMAPDGTVLTYPKPLTISRHTLHAVKTPLLSLNERARLVIQSRLHSKSGRSAGLAMSRTLLPAATMNALVQWLIPPPKFPIGRLVPDAQIATEARVAGMIVIERGGDGDTALSGDEALDVLMSNCDDAYGFPPYPVIQRFLHSRNGSDLRRAERDVVASALSGVPTTVMASETMNWSERLPAIVEPRATSWRLDEALLPKPALIEAERGV
jgi:Glycosyl transferase family 2